MTAIAKSEIFFVVATVSTIILTLIAAIAGIYFIKLLKDLRKIARNIKVAQRFIKSLLSKF